MASFSEKLKTHLHFLKTENTSSFSEKNSCKLKIFHPLPPVPLSKIKSSATFGKKIDLIIRLFNITVHYMRWLQEPFDSMFYTLIKRGFLTDQSMFINVNRWSEHN